MTAPAAMQGLFILISNYFMQKELTYILGAGASFQSIPIVKTFNSRLLDLKYYLKRRGGAQEQEYRKQYYYRHIFVYLWETKMGRNFPEP